MSVLLHRKGAISSAKRRSTSSAYYLAPGGNDSNPGTVAQPFATFAKAQSAMQLSSFKTVYLRSGVYNITQMLTLTAADNGETWSVYPGDAMNSAIIDASGMTFDNCGNNNILLIQGGNNITINGLELRNFANGAGITVHGGPAYFDYSWQGCLTYATTGAAHGNTISNNIVHDLGFGANDIIPYGNVAGIGAWGDVQNTIINNNVLHNIGGQAINIGVLQMGPSHGIDNVVVHSNFAYNVNISAGAGDTTAFYAVDRTSSSIGATFRNNFVRDYNTSPIQAAWGIGLDDSSANITITGNIIAGGGAGTTGFGVHVGSNNHFTGNIIDLSTAQSIGSYLSAGTSGLMAGNTFTNNIVISPGGGGGFYVGNGPSFIAPTVANNDYYNYAGSQISAAATGYNATVVDFSDPSPNRFDPQISGWDYQIAPGSPVYGSPVNFPHIIGNWGPPGYQIPHTGTAPSSSAGNPFSSLVDPFNATSLNTALWTQSTAGTTTMSYAATGAVVTFPGTAGASDLGRITSNATFDLTGSSITLHIITAPNTATSADASFMVYADASNSLRWLEENGTMYAERAVSGSMTILTSFAYSSSTHAYWRMSESAGVITWWTSADGIAWTSRATWTYGGFSITNMRAQIDGSCWKAETSAGIFKYNLLNS